MTKRKTTLDTIRCLRIREVREKAGMSQERLAELANSCQQHISNMERGVSSPTVRMLGRLADALGVSAKRLL